MHADRIYITRENRTWLKEKRVRHNGIPLCRPPKQEKSSREKLKERKERSERNHVEARFGQPKKGYGFNQIAAKLKNTSESWVNSIFFVMNLMKLAELAAKNGLNWLFNQLMKRIMASEAFKLLLSSFTRPVNHDSLEFAP